MKNQRILAIALVALFVPIGLKGQEKQNTGNAAAKSPIAFRVLVVLTELDVAKKISSMPYTIPFATLNPEERTVSSIRVGVRVPVASTNSKTGENSIQYIDIGTNIDARIRNADPDRYILDLTVERSSLYIRQDNKDGRAEGREWAPGDPAPGHEPLIHEFRGNVMLLLRDGQTGEATVATDPLTGHTMKVELTLNVVK